MSSSPTSKPAEDAPASGKKKKEPPANFVIPPPKPKLSKAERRALQEQQRAEKAARGGAPRPSLQQPNPEKSTESNTSSSQTAAGGNKVGGTGVTSGATTSNPQSSSLPGQQASGKDYQSVSLVSHLPPYHDPKRVFGLIGPTIQLSSHAASISMTGSTSSSQQQGSLMTASSTLHPSVLQLGLDYATLRIRGGNARCRAMLQCFRTLLSEYEPPASVVDIRQALLHDVLNPAFAFWTHSCRPHSVSMGNAFTLVKHVVASLDRTGVTSVQGQASSSSSLWNTQQKQELLDTIQQYERERIDFAGVAIAEWAVPMLSKQEEVILTFGYSEAVDVVLTQLVKSSQDDETKQQSLSRVIVVDSRPEFGGKRMLRRLREAGVPCSYILINALSYVLQDVTKVLLGASALMSDGSVLGQVGTGCVALAARMHHIPVLVCCETYKISNKLYLESITHNELGNPSALDIGNDVKEEENCTKSSNPTYKKLHLMYDLTPASFVSGIVTELGIVPATSVAVLLREMTPQEFKYED